MVGLFRAVDRRRRPLTGRLWSVGGVRCLETGCRGRSVLGRCRRGLPLRRLEGNLPLRQGVCHIGPLGLRVRIHRTVTGNGRLKRRIQQRRRLGIRRDLLVGMAKFL